MKCIGNGESRDIVVLLKDRIDSLTKRFNQNVAYIEDINASDISEEEKEMKTQCARRGEFLYSDQTFLCISKIAS